eukprot:429816-Prymnesium_polylepis.1
MEELSLSINFKMCADCHAFFKEAAWLLDRPITVREPKLTHTFDRGQCSCGDCWRWESRRAKPQGSDVAVSGPGAARCIGRLAGPAVSTGQPPAAVDGCLYTRARRLSPSLLVDRIISAQLALRVTSGR